MPLRCDEIFKNTFIANLLINLSIKNFKNWLAFGEVTDKSLCPVFLVHSVQNTLENLFQQVKLPKQNRFSKLFQQVALLWQRDRATRLSV